MKKRKYEYKYRIAFTDEQWREFLIDYRNIWTHVAHTVNKFSPHTVLYQEEDAY